MKGILQRNFLLPPHTFFIKYWGLENLWCLFFLLNAEYNFFELNAE